MCNEAARRAALHLISSDFNELKIVLRFPGGAPNMGRQESIRSPSGAVIVRIAPTLASRPRRPTLPRRRPA